MKVSAHLRSLLHGALLALTVALTACRGDLLADDASSADYGRLEAQKNAMLTRTVPPNANFAENTRYRLWAYDGEGTYLFDRDLSPKRPGIPARETHGHYIGMDVDNAQRLRTRFTVLGFTDCLPTEATDFSAETGELMPDGTLEAPTYPIRYDASIAEGFRDYMRGELHYDRAAGQTSPIVEFVHILSRVRVQVIQEGTEDTDQDGKLDGIFGLRLYSAELTDMYSESTYDVRHDTHNYGDAPQVADRELKNVGEGVDIIPAEATDAPFSESYIIPTARPKGSQSEGDGPQDPDAENATDAPTMHTLRLVIGGTDAPTFSDQTAPGYTDRYVVEVPLTDRYRPDDEGNYTEPLEFHANSSYMLRVVFAKDGIVTFSPQVYPWFDGETEDFENGEGYEEQALGNTFLFNNLIWSDRNLGADDYEPRDVSRYEGCTGFYYQYARNIPYYPMVVQDGKLTDQLVDGTLAYPVISRGQNAPPTGISQTSAGNANNTTEELKYITDINHLYEELEAGKSPAYFFYQSGFQQSTLWDNPLTQPVPPGWRIPTLEDLYSIFPSCTYAGNITFQRVVSLRPDGAAGSGNGAAFSHSTTAYRESYEDNEYYKPPRPDAGQPHDLNIIYCNVPTDPEHPNVPSGKDIITTEHSYTGGGPDQTTPDASGNYTPTPAYDPEPGYSSEYLISKRYGDEFSMPAKPLRGGRNYIGVIYGIKKVGTDEAYRMRWRVKNADPENKENRYYLIVERYTAKASDRLSYNKEDANYYRNYDWSRPVAVLYLPLVGMIGDAGWNNGELGNFGTEVLYGTSEAGTPQGTSPRYQTTKMYHLKIHGTNPWNQFLYPSDERRGTGAQLRLVRESTYQSGNQ